MHVQLINHIGNIAIPYCLNCDRASKHFTCTVYPLPIERSRLGCFFSTIAKEKRVGIKKEKIRTGQQKGSKKKTKK